MQYCQRIVLEFTPLEFETIVAETEYKEKIELEFTPLEFETTYHH